MGGPDEEDVSASSEGPFGEEKTTGGSNDGEQEQQEEVDITKIIVDHTHDPPTNIGLLENVLPVDEDHDKATAEINRMLKSGKWEKVLDDHAPLCP